MIDDKTTAKAVNMRVLYRLLDVFDLLVAHRSMQPVLPCLIFTMDLALNGYQYLPPLLIALLHKLLETMPMSFKVLRRFTFTHVEALEQISISATDRPCTIPMKDVGEGFKI